MTSRLRCVALIDDDDVDNYIHRRAILRSGLADEVRVFTSALDALEFFRTCTEEVGLVLLDINMPCMDGFEFLEAYEALREDPRDETIILMLSSSEARRDSERARQTELIRGLEPKPLTPERFCSIVDAHFG